MAFKLNYVYIQTYLDPNEVGEVFHLLTTLKTYVKELEIVDFYIFESFRTESYESLKVEQAMELLKSGVKVYGFIQGAKTPSFGFSRHEVRN